MGDFCPDETCPDYGKRQSDRQHNIIKYGKTKTGRQRYKCKTCRATFTETKGTIFYRRRTPEDEIIDTLALIAEGNRISSLARAKGHKEDTIIDWIREAGQHAEAMELVGLGRGMTIAVESEGEGPPVTTLIGTVDQAALHSVLRRLYSLGLPLISVIYLECGVEKES